MSDANLLKAGAWMLGSVISFSAMAIAGRELSRELDTFEVMAYRSVIGLCIVGALLVTSGQGPAQLRSQYPGNHVLRNIVHFSGQNLWFYGVATIPLSQLVALEFTSPIWVALLAPVLLAERLTGVRVLAALLGFAGVLVVVEPGTGTLGPGHAAGLGAALAFAMTSILTKRIMTHDTVLCVLFWMVLSQLVMGLALSLPGGITLPSLPLLPWVAVTGVAGLTAHFSLTSALSHAPASVVAPMEFGRLPVIALAGWLLYAEPLSLAVLGGGVLILTANLINVAAEQRRNAAG